MRPSLDQEILIDHRRLRVADLYCRGVSCREIGERLELNKIIVHHDVTAIRKEWREARVEWMTAAVEEQLEKFDWIEREASEAWERSKLPAKTTTQTEDADGNVTVKIERREQTGDGKYLDARQKAIDSRCKLLGLNAPVKTEATVNGTMNLNHYEQPLTREQLAAQIRERFQKTRLGISESTSHENLPPAPLVIAPTNGSNGNGKHYPQGTN